MAIRAKSRGRDQRRNTPGALRQLREAQHGDDAGHREGRGGVDPIDPRMRVRAADDAGVQGPRVRDVVEVTAPASEESPVFLALDGGPDTGRGCADGLGHDVVAV